MPSKGKRVASRQSNLRRRRGNANRNAPGRPNIPVAATAVADAPSGTAPASAATASATAQAAPASAPAPAARPASQPRGRRFERPAAYNHVGSELKRIGIFSGILVVVLVAVSFVL